LLLGFDTQAHGPSCPQKNADTSGPARDAGTQPRPDIEALLRVRAYRLHNRNAKAAEVYLRKHAILARGVCFDD
jgi:hypothetical protein